MRDAQPVVAEIVRSGVVEGHHYGAVVALDGLDTPSLVPREGYSTNIGFAVGDVTGAVLPRSCNKPLQALAMVGLGLDLPPDLLALACASHSGEQFHVDGARRILAGAGLDETALQTPPDWPIDEATRIAHIRAGGEQAPILMNCSGKHAAMLATCVLRGWPTSSYLEPDHPLQVAIAETFAAMTGEPIEHSATDGCGAPLLSTSLTGLARAFSLLVRGLEPSGEPSVDAARVRDAIVAHPEFVSGTTRDERALLTAIPGAIGKAGAESCYVVALPDGRAVALKTDDGAPRVRPVLMAAALQRLGVLDLPGIDADAVRRTGTLALLGGGQPVGEIRAAF